MKDKKHTLLECLFGHHDYSKKLTEDKDGLRVHLCKICKRSGYRKDWSGHKVWCDYNEEGNCVCEKGIGWTKNWI